MSVAASLPIDPGAEAAPVRQLHQDALRALDDVMVGEDVAFGVDDEAAACSAPLVVVDRRSPDSSCRQPGMPSGGCARWRVAPAVGWRPRC